MSKCDRFFCCNHGINLDEQMLNSIKRLKEAGLYEKLSTFSIDTLDDEILELLAQRVKHCFHFQNKIVTEFEGLFFRVFLFDREVFRLPPIFDNNGVLTGSSKKEKNFTSESPKTGKTMPISAQTPASTNLLRELLKKRDNLFN